MSKRIDVWPAGSGCNKCNLDPNSLVCVSSSPFIWSLFDAESHILEANISQKLRCLCDTSKL